MTHHRPGLGTGFLAITLLAASACSMAPLVIAAWPIGESDFVSTPQEGDVSLDEVKKGIDEGPRPTVAPSPDEPWPSGPG